MAKKQKLTYVVKREEFLGKLRDVFYLNGEFSFALDVEHENYKDNLITQYEKILYYSQVADIEFIDRRVTDYEKDFR